jgi:capsular polysaccharide biosynthesis protein
MECEPLLCAGGDVSRTLPVNYCEEDSRYFAHELLKQMPDVYLKSVDNIHAFGNGILSDGINVLPVSFPLGYSPDAIYSKKARVMLFAARYIIYFFGKRLQPASLWITDTWSRSYFHWMTDALPRLVAAQEMGLADILLPQNLSHLKYIGASLKPFRSGVIRFTGRAVHCRRLLIPAHTAPTGNYNEGLVRKLRDVYASYYRGSSAKEVLPDKVFVSRRKALKRKISNEQECISLLVRYGFHVVCLEDYEFDQQAQMCLAAKFMVSSHGAGLTNMLFMNAGTSVLELRKRLDFHNNCYFALASALSLKYYYQLCESFNPIEDAHTANLVVDPLELELNIKKMLLDCGA